MKRKIYKSIRSWPYTEFITICKDLKRISSRKQQWLNMIEAGKLTCPVTNLKVHEVRLDVNIHKSGTESYHYNFYSKCGQMFTVDHIYPLSKGGAKMKIDNLQPMIEYHNHKKSDSI